MIELILQNNKSEEICVDKNVVNVDTVNAVLKNATNIVNPVFLLELPTLPEFNYVTCNELNRSFFVRDIVSLSNRMYNITCECDVLSTYKDAIRNQEAIIKRQENEWNLYYNDGSFRTYQNPHVITKTFPSGFNPNSPSFVLAVTGGIEDVE